MIALANKPWLFPGDTEGDLYTLLVTGLTNNLNLFTERKSMHLPDFDGLIADLSAGNLGTDRFNSIVDAYCHKHGIESSKQIVMDELRQRLPLPSTRRQQS